MSLLLDHPRESSGMKREFYRNDFIIGFQEISRQLKEQAESPKPLVIVVAGGFLAVHRWKTRLSTKDCDYIPVEDSVEPELYEELYLILRDAAKDIAEKRGWNPGWLNDQMDVFIDDETANITREELMAESIEQGCLVYRSDSLLVYAVKWEWNLASKVARHVRDMRMEDLEDMVNLVREIVTRDEKDEQEENDSRKDKGEREEKGDEEDRGERKGRSHMDEKRERDERGERDAKGERKEKTFSEDDLCAICHRYGSHHLDRRQILTVGAKVAALYEKRFKRRGLVIGAV